LGQDVVQQDIADDGSQRRGGDPLEGAGKVGHVDDGAERVVDAPVDQSMLIGALSLVIVVWLGTSMNCSRRSVRRGRSTHGRRKTSPGPFTRSGPVRPKRKMTSRSYSFTTRMDCVAKRTSMASTRTIGRTRGSIMLPSLARWTRQTDGFPGLECPQADV